MTNQEALSQAYLGLMDQGRRSVMPEGVACRYRGPDGLKCGVGMLVPYAFAVRMDLIGDIRKCLRLANEDIRDHFRDVNVDLLVDIQQAHDGLCYGTWPNKHEYSPQTFRVKLTEKFQEIAATYGLTLPEWTPSQDAKTHSA